MGKPKTQTVVQESGPPKIQQPYLKEGWQGASDWLKAGGTQVAGFDPLQTQGQQMALNTAQNFMPQVTNRAAGTTGFLLNDAAYVSSNPYLQDSIRGAIRPVAQQLTEDILPSIRSGAVDAGQYGSSRQGIAEGIAISRANQQALDTAAGMSSQGYNTGLNAMLQGLAFTPQLMQMGLAPSNVVSGIGAQNQGMQQALNNQDLANLQAYMGLVGGNYGTSSTQSTTTPNNPLGGAIGGGALGLAALGGPLGIGIGALAGGLLG